MTKARKSNATRSELRNFYWSCHVAALVIKTLPANAMTKSNSRHAVRNATLALVGRNGIRFASAHARQIQAELGRPFEECSLVREHAVPISELHRRVVDVVRQPLTDAEAAAALARMDAEMVREGLDAATIAEFPRNPHAALVADVVRQWTHIAWVSAEDDRKLKARQGSEKSLNQRMPTDWDGVDPFARYRACGLGVEPIASSDTVAA